MITLEGLNFRQKCIAEALWSVESDDVLIAICLVYGKQEVRVVQEMMLAASLDTFEDIDQAQQLLKQFRK